MIGATDPAGTHIFAKTLNFITVNNNKMKIYITLTKIFYLHTDSSANGVRNIVEIDASTYDVLQIVIYSNTQGIMLLTNNAFF